MTGFGVGAVCAAFIMGGYVFDSLGHRIKHVDVDGKKVSVEFSPEQTGEEPDEAPNEQ